MNKLIDVGDGPQGEETLTPFPCVPSIIVLKQKKYARSLIIVYGKSVVVDSLNHH